MSGCFAGVVFISLLHLAAAQSGSGNLYYRDYYYGSGSGGASGSGSSAKYGLGNYYDDGNVKTNSNWTTFWQATPDPNCTNSGEGPYEDSAVSDFDEQVLNCIETCVADRAYNCTTVQLTAKVDDDYNSQGEHRAMLFECTHIYSRCQAIWAFNPYVWHMPYQQNLSPVCPPLGISSSDYVAVSEYTMAPNGSCKNDAAPLSKMQSTYSSLSTSNDTSSHKLPPEDCAKKCQSMTLCNRIEAHWRNLTSLYCDFYYDGCVNGVNYNVFYRNDATYNSNNSRIGGATWRGMLPQTAPNMSNLGWSLQSAVCIPVQVGFERFKKLQESRDRAFKSCALECYRMGATCNRIDFRGDIVSLDCYLYWDPCYGAPSGAIYNRWFYAKNINVAVTSTQQTLPSSPPSTSTLPSDYGYTIAQPPGLWYDADSWTWTQDDD